MGSLTGSWFIKRLRDTVPPYMIMHRFKSGLFPYENKFRNHIFDDTSRHYASAPFKLIIQCTVTQLYTLPFHYTNEWWWRHNNVININVTLSTHYNEEWHNWQAARSQRWLKGQLKLYKASPETPSISSRSIIPHHRSLGTISACQLQIDKAHLQNQQLARLVILWKNKQNK